MSESDVTNSGEEPAALSVDERRDRLGRIARAYDAETLRRLAHQLADRLGDHFGRTYASGGRVLNWQDPPDAIRDACEFVRGGPGTESFDRGPQAESGAIQTAVPSAARQTAAQENESLRDSVDRRFDELIGEMLRRGHNLHDPRYIGHQVPAPVPIAGLFDALGAVTNQVMAVYEMGPWATAVERAMLLELGKAIGWDEDAFAGLVTHGGSLGNLTALLTARNVAIGDAWEAGMSGRAAPVLVAQHDAHYSVARAAGVIGIGTHQVVRAALNDRRQLDPQRLDDLLGQLRRDNRPIVAVSAAACATPIGAFDPLRDVAAVCRRHDVWLHVDAAHGGAACLSRRYRHLVDGLDQADSVVWDAHKMLFVPALCAFVFYRNRDHRFEAFRQDAPYLFDPSAPGLAEYDSGMLTPECTKRAAVYGLWGTWSLFGRQLFEDLVDHTFDMGRWFYERLRAEPDFEPLHEPQCNIVAFRHVPGCLANEPEPVITKFLHELRRDLIRSGDFYIVQASINGRQALRVTIINPLTTTDHLDALLAAIRETGRRILKRTGIGS